MKTKITFILSFLFYSLIYVFMMSISLFALIKLMGW